MDIEGLESLNLEGNIVVNQGGVNSHQLAVPNVVYNEEVNKYQYTIDIVNSSYVDTIEINYKIEKAIRLQY